MQHAPAAAPFLPSISNQGLQRLLRARGGRQEAAAADASGQISAVRGGGQPLPSPVRAFYEPRFARELGGVRLHTGGRAESAAQAVNAQAFTLGQDIVFGRGEYAPETAVGRRLLAHELVHTLQEGGEGQVRRAETPGYGEHGDTGGDTYGMSPSMDCGGAPLNFDDRFNEIVGGAQTAVSELGLGAGLDTGTGNLRTDAREMSQRMCLSRQDLAIEGSLQGGDEAEVWVVIAAAICTSALSGLVPDPVLTPIFLDLFLEYLPPAVIALAQLVSVSVAALILFIAGLPFWQLLLLLFALALALGLAIRVIIEIIRNTRERRRRTECRAILWLARGKAQHRECYADLRPTLFSDPLKPRRSERNLISQIRVWEEAMPPSGVTETSAPDCRGRGRTPGPGQQPATVPPDCPNAVGTRPRMSLDTYCRGVHRGLSFRDIVRPCWDRTRKFSSSAFSMDVDHIIELQYTTRTDEPGYNTPRNLQLLDWNANRESGRLQYRWVSDERDRVINAGCREYQYVPLPFAEVRVRDEGPVGDYWTWEDVRLGVPMEYPHAGPCRSGRTSEKPGEAGQAECTRRAARSPALETILFAPAPDLRREFGLMTAGQVRIFGNYEFAEEGAVHPAVKIMTLGFDGSHAVGVADVKDVRRLTGHRALVQLVDNAVLCERLDLADPTLDEPTMSPVGPAPYLFATPFETDTL